MRWFRAQLNCRERNGISRRMTCMVPIQSLGVSPSSISSYTSLPSVTHLTEQCDPFSSAIHVLQQAHSWTTRAGEGVQVVLLQGNVHVPKSESSSCSCRAWATAKWIIIKLFLLLSAKILAMAMQTFLNDATVNAIVRRPTAVPCCCALRTSNFPAKQRYKGSVL